MKRTIIIISGFLIIIPVIVPARNRIGVVKSKYDRVDHVLDAMRIKYDLIDYHSLENRDLFKNYDVMFFPCGMDYTMETNLDVLSSGINIQSVTFKKKIYEPDTGAMADNIKDFIKSGGAAYFSGYSFELVNKAFDIITFNDNFPYMGLPGRIESRLMGDLESFCMKDMMALYMTHAGWISIKSVSGAEVIAKGEYDTPRGIRSGPISFIDEPGTGVLLYTSYHNTMYSDFRRFNVYRVIGARLISELESAENKYEQTIMVRMADSFFPNENSRTYSFNLHSGENSIYVLSQSPVQIDLYDGAMDLIESRDSFDRLQSIDVDLEKNETCYVRVYPSTNERFALYSIVSARGWKVFPYFKKIVFALFMVLLALGALALYNMYGRKPYVPRRWVR
jgi:hypothetical protein